MGYNDILKALNSSGSVREMIPQQHSAHQNTTQATKKLGDLWQQYPKLQVILSDCSGSEMGMQLTTIANQPSMHPRVGNIFVQRAFVHCLTKLNWKSKVNMSYPSGNFHQANIL